MKKIEVFDPHEVEQAPHSQYRFGAPEKPEGQIEDARAIELWNTVMRPVFEKKKRVLRTPDNVSQVLARKVYEFRYDTEHTGRKFDHDNLTAKEVFEAAGFSKSKWNRINGGRLTDVERGNVYALAIALRLDADQTAELMYAAGLAINYELDLDAAMMYFINREIYDMEYICSVLSNFSDVTNGLDCFAFQPDPKQKAPKRSKKKK